MLENEILASLFMFSFLVIGRQDMLPMNMVSFFALFGFSVLVGVLVEKGIDQLIMIRDINGKTS